MIEPEKTSDELALERTGLSHHRTSLSEKRTGMSEHRTDLSEVRSHLANERTHLAYMRTGISLVSLGITMNRFSWFLIDNKSMSRYGGHTFLNDAKNVGLGMVILGSILLIWSLIRFRQTFSSIKTGIYHPSTKIISMFTLGLILTGVVSIIWLMTG